MKDSALALGAPAREIYAELLHSYYSVRLIIAMALLSPSKEMT